jgi:hypothetical protein
MKRFDKKTFLTLSKAGWYPNRRVNIHQKIEFLNNLNFHTTEEMNSFLTEFDNLYLIYSNGDSIFDFRTYKTDFDSSQINIRNGMIGESCLLIGSFCNNEFLVVITETNKMVAYNENFRKIHQIGSYFDEGINYICHFGLNPDKILNDS